MSRSKVVLALTLVVALSFTVPALAGTASPIKVAKKALGLSKKADKRSRTALKRANTAKAAAASALSKLAAAQPEAVHAKNADHANEADHAKTADTTNAIEANHAAAAAALDGLTVLGRVKAQPTAGPDFATAQANAPEVPLFSRGPMRVYGKCFSYTDGNPAVNAVVYIATTQDGVIFGGEGHSDSGNDYLKTTTPEGSRVLHDQASQDSVGSLNSADAGDGEFYAFASDGSVLQGHVYIAVKQGDPAVGDGPV